MVEVYEHQSSVPLHQTKERSINEMYMYTHTHQSSLWKIHITLAYVYYIQGDENRDETCCFLMFFLMFECESQENETGNIDLGNTFCKQVLSKLKRRAVIINLWSELQNTYHITNLALCWAEIASCVLFCAYFFYAMFCTRDIADEATKILFPALSDFRHISAQLLMSSKLVKCISLPPPINLIMKLVLIKVVRMEAAN